MAFAENTLICVQIVCVFIRRKTKQAGVYHGSVFAQLCGGVGPGALCVSQTTGVLYVARWEILATHPQRPNVRYWQVRA